MVNILIYTFMFSLLYITAFLHCRYVDGEDYMAAILDAISGARMEILIADWQLV